jgi:hypothetical protein
MNIGTGYSRLSGDHPRLLSGDLRAVWLNRAFFWFKTEE